MKASLPTTRANSWLQLEAEIPAYKSYCMSTLQSTNLSVQKVCMVNNCKTFTQ